MGESAKTIYMRQIIDQISATVRGVDLFPPPVSWMPPNSILEVDNIAEDWNWSKPLDLIHMRIMI
jgi:hypothetical protein